MLGLWFFLISWQNIIRILTLTKIITIKMPIGYNATIKNTKIRIDNGTHHFLDSEWQTEMNRRAYASGTHPFMGGKLQAKTNKRRVDDKTHNFLGPESNKTRVTDGTHNFLVSENNVHAKLT